jgi:hypothetical protein
MRWAPSYISEPAERGASPQKIAQALLHRFGDRRFIHGIRFTRPPRWILGQRTHFPRDALFASIDVPEARFVQAAHPTRQQARAGTIANWEATLIGGALRDEFCAAGGRPLVGWSGGDGGVSSIFQPFGQRFPNPTPATFRSRLARIGRRYGFRVISLRLLRPLQYAPLVVVDTHRKRVSFTNDVGAIENLINPSIPGAYTFEGDFFEARDARGVFVTSFGGERGTAWGGGWSWNHCVDPGPISPGDCGTPGP